MLKQVALFFLLILNIVSLVNSLSYEEDTRISGQERDAIIQFKAKVIPKVPKSSYVQNYIRDDLYWIHWLRAKKLNIRQAEEHFLNHLKWRERENIDTIHEDPLGEWAEFHQSFPSYFNGTVDKTGGPVGELWVGEWNVRQAVLAGRSKQLVLMMARFFEMINRRLYKARAEGNKVSQGQLLEDLENFNVIQFACAGCVPVIVAWTTMLENQYPYLFDNIMLIKIPQSFGVVLNIVKPVLTGTTAKSIISLPSKDQWMKFLDERIDRSQRSVRIGGTIVRDRD